MKNSVKAPKEVNPELTFLKSIKLRDRYYWQPTGTGASLMRDDRQTSGKRPYLGHFTTNAIKVFYGRAVADELRLSPKKREKLDADVLKVAELMAMIEAATETED